MSQEQLTDITSWWNEQTFAGKELYRLEDDGGLILQAGNNIKERPIATITPENADTVIKNLQEKYAEAAAKVKELELEWLEAEDKQKLAEKVTGMREYLQQVSAIGDMAQLAALVREWEHTLFRISEEHYTAKLKLAELAESMAESDQWKEATQAFKDIADKWKQAGHVDKNRNEKLLARIEAARKTYNDRKRLQHDEDEKDLLHNMDLKIDLVEQAESIAASQEWKKTTDAFLRLAEEWKTIGRTHNKKNEELWHRFTTAKAVFFDKKRIHFNKVRQEEEKNYEIKAALLEKAVALKDSTDWSATSLAFAALMEEWKKTGRVPHEKGDELWKQFTAAQEQFFEAKRQHTESIRVEQDANYALKKEILDHAERLKHSTNWGNATAEFTELLEDWKTIGPVPRIHSQKMWDDLLAARKYFFTRKDANKEQKKQQAVEQQAARIAQAKSMLHQLSAELKEEQEKIVDFHAAIENITPGKKAAELKAHLEKLIEDSRRQVKRIQEKLDLAGEETGSKDKDTSSPAEPAEPSIIENSDIDTSAV